MGWKNVNAVIEKRLFVGKYVAVTLLYFCFYPSFISILAAKSSRSLTERQITHIVSVCTDPIPADVPESKSIIGLAYLSLYR